jgi:hypothetical protein
VLLSWLLNVCLSGVLLSSPWAGTDPKAHDSFDGLVLMELFPTVTPQFPYPKRAQTVRILCLGKPEP